MRKKDMIRRAGIFLLLVMIFQLNCRIWSPSGAGSSIELGQPEKVLATLSPFPTGQDIRSATSLAPQGAVDLVDRAASSAAQEPEPAGCLSADRIAGMSGAESKLAYADDLLKRSAEPSLARSLKTRLLPYSWSAYAAGKDQNEAVLSLSVGDLQPDYLIQRMLYALQAAGFVTWLRDTPDQNRHILAISPADLHENSAAWQPYLDAYWQDRSAVPAIDASVTRTLKLPPCAWMVAQGFAPSVSNWWAVETGAWPNYATAGAGYLAGDNEAATQVARRINWLGQEGEEGPSTMCGPLVWSIMNDAGAFPPDWGDWSANPRSFWLAKPSENSRPWSLFPDGVYHVYHFKQPMGTFNFKQFPLYAGDFVYAYSKGDGFDHMFLVTEVDAAGNVYTVTNLIHMLPEKWVSVERVVLLNLNDPTVGIAPNQWANDRVNGRTGHAGFEVFRWAWMVKDIQQQTVSYAVQPGDSLGLLAERWKTPVEAIARYNKIASDHPLSIGQILSIPPENGAELRGTKN